MPGLLVPVTHQPIKNLAKVSNLHPLLLRVFLLMLKKNTNTRIKLWSYTRIMITREPIHQMTYSMIKKKPMLSIDGESQTLI